ncbi:hypothetical protein GF327_07215 [Candidatus Woesearchaeota archaeon]|nr:hypothetical protein [Candidatus Woesearchaeota archaeon]
MARKKKKSKRKKKKREEPPNEVCKGCLKWEKMGRECSVFWEGKKWCTLKVTSMHEWNKQKLTLKRRR